MPFIRTQPSRQLYRDTEILPIYLDCAKTHANPDPSLRSGQAPTATPHTTEPLAVRQTVRNTVIPNAQARVLQPIPATVPAAKHMLLLPTRTLPLRQLYHDTKTPVRLPGLCRLDKFIMTRKLLPVNLDFAAKTTLV